MLSKKHQAQHLKKLQDQITEYEEKMKNLQVGGEAPVLDTEARMYKEYGIVRE